VTDENFTLTASANRWPSQEVADSAPFEETQQLDSPSEETRSASATAIPRTPPPSASEAQPSIESGSKEWNAEIPDEQGVRDITLEVVVGITVAPGIALVVLAVLFGAKCRRVPLAYANSGTGSDVDEAFASSDESSSSSGLLQAEQLPADAVNP
jgi:hypothetical protein